MKSNRRVLNIEWPLIIVLAAIIILLVGLLISGTTNNRQLDNSNLNAQAEIDIQKETASETLKKLREETSKLREETANLRVTNDSITPTTKWWTTWLTALGGIIIAVLVPIVAALLNRTQQNRIIQDREQARESHNLEVFRDLGDKDPRIRIGAVAILVQKLSKMVEDAKKDPTPDDDIRDLPMIVSVLISATKHEEKEEIQKYIADGLANALDALVPYDESDPEYSGKPKYSESPLKKYDFQGARLENAWWRKIDARGVDFYKAHLERAGLREAFLSGAILRRANLKKSTLVKAKMGSDEIKTRTDLQEAQLEEAKLKEADLRFALLKEANLIRADLTKANLSDADLEGADLRLAILSETIFSNTTKLAGAKINSAHKTYLKGITDIENVIWDDSEPSSSNLPAVIFP